MFSKVFDLLKEKAGDVSFVLEPASETGRGNVSTNLAFAYAKKHGGSPKESAEEIKAFLLDNGADFISDIEIAGPGFLNITFSKKAIQNEFIKIQKSGDNWGRLKQGGTVVLDYSAPNIGKPMSVAHLRSTIIGQSLKNIFTFAGWKAISDNHLGDWGKQFGVLISAYKENKIENPTVQDLLKMYVDFSARMKDDESLNERAREETRLLQEGDKENIKIWKELSEVNLKELHSAYDILGTTFDYELGESTYNKDLAKIVEDALKSGVAKRSEGAVIIPFEKEGWSPFVIQKSDGSYLYSTTDIATFLYRQKHMKPDLLLYVVDNGQGLHFQQLFTSLSKLGVLKGEKLEHIKFGLVLSAEHKKLSTRDGDHVPLMDVINEAVDRAREVVDKKQGELSDIEKEKIAKIVGIGAILYNDLSQNRQSDIMFDWDKMLSFEGNSGPYLQYTYARLQSILRKAGKLPKKFDVSALDDTLSLSLIMKLDYFPKVIELVTETYYPHYLAGYLHELARDINAYYEKEPVLKAKDEKVRDARLNLVNTAAMVLKSGLGLLGIQVVDRM